MYYFLLVVFTFICYSSADFNRVQVPTLISHSRDNKGLSKSKNNVIPSGDETYLDKPDNKMLIPVAMDELRLKKKLRKHPRSTIQKIIARNRKNKKVMAKRLTTKPTIAPASDDMIEEFDDRDDDPTTQVATKKRPKKWNNKITKYHSQIQKMQARNIPKHKRTRRHADRDNTIIFQDFDEFEFLDKKKDYDIVKTHFKKYW